MVANQLGVQETLDAEVLGLRVRSVERTLDKFTYVHQPRRQRPSINALDRENSREKGRPPRTLVIRDD